MKEYKPKDHHQALILACKGHLRRDTDNSSVESIKRVICEIIGFDEPELIMDNIINYWLYEVYEWLLEVEETWLKRRNNLKQLLLGNLSHNYMKDKSFEEIVTSFLVAEINLCQVYEENVFRIELDKNNDYMVR